MSEPVVVAFEIVDIDENESDGIFRAYTTKQLVVERLVEITAIEQTGQVIPDRVLLQLFHLMLPHIVGSDAKNRQSHDIREETWPIDCG